MTLDEFRSLVALMLRRCQSEFPSSVFFPCGRNKVWIVLSQMSKLFSTYGWFITCVRFLSFSPRSVQEPHMQGVQVSDRGQQVDARARANGGVHVVLQHSQTAALTVHPGGHEPVSHFEISLLIFPVSSPACSLHQKRSLPDFAGNGRQRCSE